MTEKDIIKLDFKRNDVTAEESGYPTDWHYYTYVFTSGLCLISCDNDEAKEEDDWYVEIFDMNGIKFTNVDNLHNFIWLIKNAEVK